MVVVPFKTLLVWVAIERAIGLVKLCKPGGPRWHLPPHVRLERRRPCDVDRWSEENGVNFWRIANSWNPYGEIMATSEFAWASAAFVSQWWGSVQCRLLQDAIAQRVTCTPPPW